MSIEQDELAAIRKDVITRGQRIYDEQLKEKLEPEQTGRFVAIDPETGRYFLGDTSAEATGAAHDPCPESHFYLMRIGYTAAHTIRSYG